MRITTKVRLSLKTDHIKKRYTAGRNKSLDRIGSILTGSRWMGAGGS